MIIFLTKLQFLLKLSVREINMKDEEKKEKNKKPKLFLVAKIIAVVLFLVGIPLFISSFFVGGDGTFEAETTAMGLRFGGMCACIFGLSALFFGFAPNLHRTSIKTQKYIIDENKDDLKDIVDAKVDISKDAIRNVVGSVRDGIVEGAKDESEEASVKSSTGGQIFCKHCGKQIDADSKFCSYCGKEQ